MTSPMADCIVGIDLKMRALDFAISAHDNSPKPFHRDGKKAYEHSIRVALEFADDPILYSVAVLHDVLEDCPTITQEKLGDLFGFSVAQAVVALSRSEGESWSSYINRVRQNPMAVLVKIADIKDNMARADEQFRKKIAMYEATLGELKLHVENCLS